MPKESQKGDKKHSKRMKNDENELKDSQKGFKMGSTSVKTVLERYQRGKKQRKGSLKGLGVAAAAVRCGVCAFAHTTTAHRTNFERQKCTL